MQYGELACRSTVAKGKVSHGGGLPHGIYVGHDHIQISGAAILSSVCKKGVRIR